MVLEVLWFEKIRPTWKDMQLFFYFYLFFGGRFLWGIFPASLWKFGQNPSQPQKFACSYTCAQTGWSHWHVIFLVFSFVISGFCFLFRWMLFLAESLSSLWKYFFLVRIHCSVYYIIKCLLVACCMCSWVSYLFGCKPQLIKFFHHFMRLTIKGGLYFLFLYFIERYRRRSVFPWLRFVDQILLSHSIFFSTTFTSVSGEIMINRRQLQWYSHN